MTDRDTKLFVGRRDHYRRAADLVATAPNRVILTQRSSTLLLGPELGWHGEADFFEAARQSIASGTEWLHVASASGMRSHLRRVSSTFGEIETAQRQLSFDGGVVGLQCDSRAVSVKNLDRYSPTSDFKMDRQARVLIADFGSRVEAVVVEDMGDRQITLHLGGSAARDLFEVARDFWSHCPPLRLADYEAALDASPSRLLDPVR